MAFLCAKFFVKTQSITTLSCHVDCTMIENEETKEKQFLDCRASMQKLKQAPLKVKRCNK